MISLSGIFIVAKRICEKILRCARDIQNAPIKLFGNFPTLSRNPITIQRNTKLNLYFDIFKFTENYSCCLQNKQCSSDDVSFTPKIIMEEIGNDCFPPLTPPPPMIVVVRFSAVFSVIYFRLREMSFRISAA